MVDIETLRAGLANMDGTVHDALVVLVRLSDELSKMTTSAQLLLNKQNLATAAFDNWSTVIHGLSDRHTSFHDEAMSSTSSDGSEDYASWEALKGFACEVARVSNELQSQLDGHPWYYYALLGCIVALVFAGLLHYQGKLIPVRA